jgi:hypothetical protein
MLVLFCKFSSVYIMFILGVLVMNETNFARHLVGHDFLWLHAGRIEYSQETRP